MYSELDKTYNRLTWIDLKLGWYYYYYIVSTVLYNSEDRTETNYSRHITIEYIVTKQNIFLTSVLRAVGSGQWAVGARLVSFIIYTYLIIYYLILLETLVERAYTVSYYLIYKLLYKYPYNLGKQTKEYLLKFADYKRFLRDTFVRDFNPQIFEIN